MLKVNHGMKNIVAILVCFLVCSTVCLFTGIVIGRIWQYETDKQNVAILVALRLGVDSDWESIRTHVFCKVLVIGATRKSIEDSLSKIGIYTQTKNSTYPYVIISFDDPFISAELSDLRLWFDEKETLRGKFRGTNFNQTPIECP